MKIREDHLLGADQRGAIPKNVPPKYDPVAASLDAFMRVPINESTLRVWRDTITRTCGGSGSASTKNKHGAGWILKHGWMDNYSNSYEEGDLMCAH